MHEKSMIVQLSQMPLGIFIQKMNSMTAEERKQLLSNPYLDELNPVIFSSLFLQLKSSEAKQLLTNPKIYHKVLTSPKNSKKRTILNIVGEKDFDLLKYIFESDYFSLYKDQFREYIDTISHDNFQYLLENVDFTKLYSSFLKENSIEEVENSTGIHNLDINVSSAFFQKIKTNQLNPLGLLKVKNEKEFLIYTKFGLCVPVLDELEDITLKNGFVVPYQSVLDLKESKIVKLIQLLKEKGDCTTEELLEVGLKLYFVFGYDNGRKIILDKFTNITPNSILTISDFNFTDYRREYRTKHQKEFYHYGMVDELLSALEQNNHEFFSNLLYNADSFMITQLEQEFLDMVSKYKDRTQLKDKLKTKIIELVNQRESQVKDGYTKDIKERLSSSMPRSLSTVDLKNLLQEIFLPQILKKYDQDIILRLQKFLLGNGKANNDCFLRLIINKEALGLNGMLGTLVNQYDVIESIAKQNNLSLNSLLDVIDIVKTSFVSLKPNEQDIFLSTIVKVISYKEYCNGMNNEEILKEVGKLHVERKKKVYSSIPTVEGVCNDFHYQVAPFDAEYLLSAGADSKNCFCISGYGEDFFRYCLTSNQAVIMYFTNPKTNHTYICPIVRSGNGIHCNGVDPELPIDERESFFAAFTEAMNKIITISEKESKDEEKIEVATVTDLHLKEYFADADYSKYDLGVYLPLHQHFYTDYNKKKITHYIIAEGSEYKENKYYLSEDKFYQPRSEDYEFDIDKEYDKERLSLIVNSIAYSAIDYQRCSTAIKNRKKRNFKPIDVNDFQYIIGNKDWYVAIDNQYNILANLLPYDERARKDYIKQLVRAPLIIENMQKEEYDYGVDRENSKKNK